MGRRAFCRYDNDARNGRVTHARLSSLKKPHDEVHARDISHIFTLLFSPAAINDAYDALRSARLITMRPQIWDFKQLIWNLRPLPHSQLSTLSISTLRIAPRRQDEELLRVTLSPISFSSGMSPLMPYFTFSSRAYGATPQ